jgi:hypothetical protein
VRRTLVGIVLLVAGALGAYLGIMGMVTEDTSGDGAVMVTVVTLGASIAIAFFGIRYLLLGIMGKGVSFFEGAVEAEFQNGLRVLPVRRTVPLLQIRLSGSDRLTYGQAITTTGHAFRLPAAMVERSDPWYLGSLGRSPIAPGGRVAKERFDKGELEPYEHPVSDPLPDHGPAWPDPGTLPITVDVPVEPAPEAKVEPSAQPPPRPTVQPPVVVDVSARREPSPERAPPAPPAPSAPPAVEPEMEVVMDLPDVVPPPETPRVQLPPPPEYRPRTVSIPEPPEHREMDRDEDLEPIAPPGPPPSPAPEPSGGPPPSPEPVAGPAPSPPAEPGPPTPPAASDEWELEELPPPEVEKKKTPPSSGWDWEEL